MWKNLPILWKEFFIMEFILNRPWSQIPIKPLSEPLLEIPVNFHRLEPHPYLSIGAPYGSIANPWMLRNEVIKFLEIAQNLLKAECNDLRLAIFDAWRPISVQEFMVNHVIKTECKVRGIKPNSDDQSKEFLSLINEVEQFWAPPSVNPLTPPPHSTGAAIDLTLADNSGPLEMGGEIDELGDISTPNFYKELSINSSNPKYLLFHSRRMLLCDVMIRAGFVQHPNEWWHFSYGDQLWAWLTHSSYAIYGSWAPDNN